ncbi:protein kinase [Blastopirellula sp. JC732]|uniref:non-specific serine/threonine protein kinase n=1 Tax=Blastopirellula sediminis TaxID=2894196 RepID=A0A9X1SHW5_9BACT|nr:protein kinase [Blastopirellula sediminis]MCC9605787.1 protein kinase [Blastopirellula sediminis]MCC9630913.1 protein kinase [Blastopirellula sediminis]
MDDQLLDLLAQWEEATSAGKPTDLTALAGGDASLAMQLRKHIASLQKIARLDSGTTPAEELHLPPLPVLRSALLTPADLSLQKFQTRLTTADIVPADKIEELLRAHGIKSAHQLAAILLEKDLLTRFQVRSISHGKTRGLKLDRYVILDKIGEGGMGQVYKARHSMMGRDVALKILPRASTEKGNALDRFLQEMQVAAQLRHPNIVTAYDADEAEGLYFFVMEYVAGRDLNSVVRKSGPLSVAKAVDYIMQAAQGLQYAHGVGLVHRDIKPANLLLDDQGVVKILDMGIARLDSVAALEGGNAEDEKEEDGLTRHGSIMGTVDFMAPEQAVDTKSVTSQADLYSLGCTLYFLLTGKPPFAGETLMQKLLGHREKSPPKLTDLRDDVPPQLEAIYQKCLAKLPEQRYASAAELAADLQALSPQVSDAAPPPLPVGEEADSDTSPSNFLETLNSPGLIEGVKIISIDPLKKPSRRARVGRGSFFYGGAILVGLLLCGLIAYGSGLLFRISTPNGTLIVEMEGEDFVAHLRDKQLVLVNENTLEKTTITLDSEEAKRPIAPGQYNFALETSSGIKTSVSELTITSGTESRVRVSWESAPTPTIPEPAPATAAQVEQPVDLLAGLNLGPWTPMFNDKDFSGWEKRNPNSIKWTIDKLSMRGANSGYRPSQGGAIFTERTDYGDFHFRCEVLAGQRGRTWVYFRHNKTWEHGARRGYGVPNPDPDALDNPDGWGIGSLYEDVFQVGDQRVAKAAVPGPRIDPGQWYTLEIIAVDNRIQIRVNGAVTVDYVADDPPAQTGGFGLGCPILSNLAVRNVFVREPKPTQ